MNMTKCERMRSHKSPLHHPRHDFLSSTLQHRCHAALLRSIARNIVQSLPFEHDANGCVASSSSSLFVPSGVVSSWRNFHIDSHFVGALSVLCSSFLASAKLPFSDVTWMGVSASSRLEQSRVSEPF